jgi:YfiH family protein
MERYELNGLMLYRFPSLNGLNGIRHAVTTRQGGVSKPPYDSLNLGLAEGDGKAVPANLEILKAAFELDKLVYAYQAHGTNIAEVDGSEELPIKEVDGLATDKPGVGLLIKQADCQAVILLAPGRALANLHVGWRGNVANMPGTGVRFMAERYGVNPSGLYAAISPSLGPCCAQFVNHQDELGPAFLPYQSRPDYFNLWRVTVDQLVQAGMKRSRIEVSGLCTRCRHEFYSYRRDKVTGRFGTLAFLV